MNRRDALRILATGMTLPLAPRSVWAGMRQAREFLGTQTTPRTLDPHQYATVQAIAEMMIPRTNTPGATDVGAVDFVDLILTEWYEESQKAAFLKGLADLDERTQTLFGKNFIDCAAAQQADMLTALGETMPAESDRAQRQRRLRAGFSHETHDNFYTMLRRLTLTAYYTSEAGATRELHFEVIPETHAGCATIAHGRGEAEHH